MRFPKWHLEMFGGSKKLTEGEEHLRKAQKYLKTNPLVLKFTPDYLAAGMELSQAATCFEAGGSFLSAIDAWLQAADTREKHRDIFAAARAYEAAATLVHREQKDSRRALELMSKAVDRFKLSGKMDVACRLLQKMAGLYESDLHDANAVERAYDECLELYDDQDKPYMATDVFKLYINFLAKQRRYDKLVAAIEQHKACLVKLQQTSLLAKEVLGQVVVYLQQDDPVRADRAVSAAVDQGEGNFLATKEYELATQAIDAYQQGDADAFKAVMSKQTWTFLPIELARMAVELRSQAVGGAMAPPAAAAPGAAGGAARPGEPGLTEEQEGLPDLT
ncbi:unnamed protein product [Vitrella brassicaformis CCMP3155]|uniref:Gamma-soluble NSF attachment protein n=2 Tax=Vitrella brassicaformis TaxID=1169539 RepID=A0A0G4ELJ5_VITBC|nr:unnamed protein product [Vitrella brassicaformis CCMP3155]|eukprot:CEL97693.1 unnamed protein product [Vitrella brassicaformis CCMP3155]